MNVVVYSVKKKKKAAVMNCVLIYTAKPTDAPTVPLYPFVTLGVVFLCVVMAVIMCVRCRKPG